jgi:hypothetical protein
MWQAFDMIDILRRFVLPAFVAAMVVACGTPEPRVADPAVPLSVTPPSERADAPVVRRDLPETPVPPIASIPARPETGGLRPGPPAALPPIVVPADAIYVCVVDSGGTRRQTVIEFVPKVHQLCRRHPEMGPCQYERNACRSAGGRVFAAAGQEITMATEVEYDRKVMRVRFRAN